MKTIEIDCAPGWPRPDMWFSHICKEILHIDVFDPVSRFFGNWTWELTEEQYPEAKKEEVGDCLRDLYHQGYVRYASW